MHPRRRNTQQVKRRLFNLAATVSLVLCGATLGVVAGPETTSGKSIVFARLPANALTCSTA